MDTYLELQFSEEAVIVTECRERRGVEREQKELREQFQWQ